MIHNGADELRFFPEKRREERRVPVVLFAGRLVPEKGAHVFVEAMWLLLARGIRARGRLLGATGFGSMKSQPAYSRSIMRDAAPNVEFGGYRPASAAGGKISPRRYFLFAFGLGRTLWPGECRSHGQWTSGRIDIRRRGSGSIFPAEAACWWSGVRRQNWRRRWKF